MPPTRSAAVIAQIASVLVMPVPADSTGARPPAFTSWRALWPLRSGDAIHPSRLAVRPPGRAGEGRPVRYVEARRKVGPWPGANPLVSRFSLRWCSAHRWPSSEPRGLRSPEGEAAEDTAVAAGTSEAAADITGVAGTT